MNTTLRSAFVLLILSVCSSASASPRWIPVIIEHPEVEQTVELVRSLATALRTEHGIDLLDPASAAQRFEQLHSAQPVELAPDEVRELVDKVHQGTMEASLGRWSKADQLMRGFEEAPQPAQDYASWKNEDLLQRRFTYCLMSAENKLREPSVPAAEAIMRQCVLMVPKLKPKGEKVSPEIFELHERILQELRDKGAASLEVNLVKPRDAGSSERRCVVMINGAPKPVPLQALDLLPVPTRVQYNCDRPGRIHIVKLKPGDNSLLIDARWEAVLQTDGHIGLRYPSITEERTSQVQDAVRIATVVAPDDDRAELLLVRKASDGRVKLARIELTLQKVVAEVDLAPAPTDDELVQAAHALASGRSGSVILVQPEPTPVVRPDSNAEATRLVGGTLAAVLAAGAFANSWLLYKDRQDALEAFTRSDSEVDFRRYEDLEFARSSAIGGSAAGTAAVMLLMPEEDGVPVWSWLVGAAGVGAAAGGTLLWSMGKACASRGCDPDETDPVLGQIVLLHAGPLLAVPLTYLLREAFEADNVSTSADIGPSGAALTLQGRL